MARRWYICQSIVPDLACALWSNANSEMNCTNEALRTNLIERKYAIEDAVLVGKFDWDDQMCLVKNIRKRRKATPDAVQSCESF